MTHTDFATRRAPAAMTPDLGAPGAAVLLLGVAGAAALAGRRRRATSP